MAERFTVIHGGAEIGEGLAADLLDSVSEWAASAAPGAARVVEVWGPPWKRWLAGCLITAAAGGGPFYVMSIPAADDLVAGVKARGVAVRYRQARQSVVDDAELRAISLGWPVRYC
ncbi:MAG TPA: hypothetical protein VHZ33_00350 [Trebonia sp.]|nr:hypothetical protein [Trebonia sp.]